VPFLPVTELPLALDIDQSPPSMDVQLRLVTVTPQGQRDPSALKAEIKRGRI